MNSLPAAAFRLAIRGVAVFPLSPRSKIPIAGTSGCRGASSDHDVVRAVWQKWPDANVGIATGPASGLWVLDIDGDEGCASLAKLEAEQGRLPTTVDVETPGGGRHLYWRWPDGGGIRNSVSRIGPNLDIRGEGGSAVAPPSIHPNGGTYQWAALNAHQGLVHAPEWLLTLARPPEPSPREPAKPLTGNVDRYVAAVAENELRALEGAPEGQRNHTLNRAAYSLAGFALAGALPEDWCWQQLESRALGLGLPLPETRRTIQSAFDAARPRELPR